MYVNFNLRRPSADSGSILGANLRISNLTGEARTRQKYFAANDVHLLWPLHIIIPCVPGVPRETTTQ